MRDVIEADSLGVTMVHLHARDEHGRPTYRKEVYARIIAGIRESCPDLIIGVSCSGRDFKTLDQRADVLNLDGDLRRTWPRSLFPPEFFSPDQRERAANGVGSGAKNAGTRNCSGIRDF
ncbi:MAG: 3-keto-5-aminohexanoate cleavage protein [Chromatiales bacterium]|nr:3-keto-5-aminohexanoate cleavage protein [Chromatiales bacterium]